ncbi:hypothetical protein SAMN05216503_2326 [Polaribacter sp. KT25b]|uniref:hypothetical protein n=1 Tax=Polaribacter sp. KT25b TaxID=1855336 RepID=UPI00087D9D92|nr:hypothetical protein [Polaribacter sp. KT25b]SDS20816.1 hypothetical protein SAMN05216503_2326 [Polaribacter sp. KT25b]
MKMKNYLLYIFFLTLSLKGHSQDVSSASEKKNALAVSFGSPGLGLEYARKLSPKLNAKLVWHSFNLKDFEQEDVEIKDDVVDILANLEVAIIDAGIEYLPFTNSSFKLTAGVGFLSNVNANGVITYTEEVVFGDVTVSKNDIGEINADTSWSGVAPYLGVGFGRAIPKKRLGFGIEFGSYFTSSPDVKLTATKLLAPTAEQEENLKEALTTFKFIPRIQLRLAYSF